MATHRASISRSGEAIVSDLEIELNERVERNGMRYCDGSFRTADLQNWVAETLDGNLEITLDDGRSGQILIAEQNGRWDRKSGAASIVEFKGTGPLQ